MSENGAVFRSWKKDSRKSNEKFAQTPVLALEPLQICCKYRFGNSLDLRGFVCVVFSSTKTTFFFENSYIVSPTKGISTYG